jgi:pSer/pThr/pTyr-binding forkhead associated (FHA) protein
MDLESTNGTLLNKEKIELDRNYELKPNEISNLGFSTREYIVMKV